MPRVIAYDLARLFIGPIFYTPRGVDRVDLAMARHVFDDDASPNLGILPTPWGVRAFPARIVRRWLAHLQHLWAEDTDIKHDARLCGLIEQMRVSFDAVPPELDSARVLQPPPSLSRARQSGSSPSCNRQEFRWVKARFRLCRRVQLTLTSARSVLRCQFFMNGSPSGRILPAR